MILALLACGAKCDKTGPCRTENGEYRVSVPENGAEPWPVWIYFHGYQGSGTQYTDNDEVVADMSEAGMLLVAPEGIDGRWSHDPLGSNGGRDDVAFAREVLTDVAERWTIDHDRVFVGGFSAGAAMAAQITCDDSDSYQAAALMSGGFWNSSNTDCSTPPIPVAHTHGTEDTTWPLDGRCFSDGEPGECEVGQMPMESNLTVWQSHLACTQQTTPSTDDILQCETWSCADGSLRFCTHDEGHTRRSGWPARQTDWLLSQ